MIYFDYQDWDQSPCPVMSSCGLLFYGFNLTCYGQSAINPEIVPGLFGSWDSPTVDILARVHSTPLSQLRFPLSKPLVLAIGFSVVRQGRQVYVSTLFSPIFYKSAETYCHNRIMSQAAGHAICMHVGSHTALPRRRVF